MARSHYHGEVLGGLRHFSQTKNFLIDVSPLYTLEGTSQLFSLDIPGAQVTPLHSYQGPEYPVDRIQMKNPCTSFLTTCCKSIDFGMGEHSRILELFFCNIKLHVRQCVPFLPTSRLLPSLGVFLK